MSEVTVMRFKGHEVPTVIVDKCLENNNYVSVAFHTMVKDKPPQITVVKKRFSAMKNVKEEVLKVLSMFKDKDMMVRFGALKDGEKDELMQPHGVVFNSDNKPLVVAFYDNIESPLEENQTWLGPKCVDIFESQQYDLEKSIEKIEKSARDFGVLCRDPDQQVTLLYANGDNAVMASKDAKVGADGDWGWHTAATIAETPAAEEEVVEEVKELTEEEQLAAALGGDEAPAPVDPKPGQGTTETPGRKLNQPAPAQQSRAERAKAAAAAKASGGAGVTHPPGGAADDNFVRLQLKKGMRQGDLLKLILRHYKVPPSNWWEDYQKDKLVLVIPKNNSNSTAISSALTNAVAAEKTDTAPAPDKKAPVISVPIPGPAPGHIPVLDSDERKEITEKFLGTPRVIALLGADGKNMDDPALLAPYEEKFPDFAEQLNLPSLAVTFHWGPEDHHELNQIAKGRGLEVLCGWLTYELIKAVKGGHKLRPLPKADTAIAKPLSRSDRAKLAAKGAA